MGASDASFYKFQKLWLALGWGLIVVVAIMSLVSLPDAHVPKGSDKLGHLLAYGVLMFWWAMLVRRTGRRAAVALALVVMGAVLEVLQGLTPNRTPELADAVANAVGVLLGWLAASTRLSRFLHRLEKLLEVQP